MTRQRKKVPKTLDELERRLHFEWKSVTLDTLKELANHMPRRLRNGRKKIKEAILATNISVIRCKMNKE